MAEARQQQEVDEVRALVSLAFGVLGDADDPRLIAAHRALDRWLAHGAAATTDELARHFDVLVSYAFGDLYCDPECCWTSDTAKAWILAAAIAKALSASGSVVDADHRFHADQDLSTVLDMAGGAKPLST